MLGFRAYVGLGLGSIRVKCSMVTGDRSNKDDEHHKIRNGLANYCRRHNL